MVRGDRKLDKRWERYIGVRLLNPNGKDDFPQSLLGPSEAKYFIQGILT